MKQGKSQTIGIPVMGFVAPKGGGKTTLLSQVVSLLTGRGLAIGVVKQARDDFDMDQPCKDSYRLRKAGVERLMLTSSQKLALFVEHPDQPLSFEQKLALLDETALDLILVEGFAEQAIPKIQLLRGENKELENLTDPWIVALATDRGEIGPGQMPRLNVDDPLTVTEFILDYFPGLPTPLKRD